MIHYTLVCSHAHEFDGWFPSSAGFDAQAARGLVECPVCGDKSVSRGLMAPAIPAKSNARPDPVAVPVCEPAETPAVVEPPAPNVAMAGAQMPDQLRAAVQKLRAEVERNCEDVGNAFADEARRMHRGESAHRAIYGQTTEAQAEELQDEGVPIAMIPWVAPADG